MDASRDGKTLGGAGAEPLLQNVVVMRHGDRIDVLEPLWVTHAERPWDPPLVEAGKIRAWTVGKKLRQLGFPIHRVIVSPFLRCLQTASEVVSALCAVDNDGSLFAVETSESVVIDPSRVKVSIEYGLCEALCREAISVDLAPKDGKWFPDISRLEAWLPDGTLDHSVERVYHELPHWEEPLTVARDRYKKIIITLADKFPHENLLLITHGEAVGVAVTTFSKGMEAFEVEFCAYSHLQRQISFDPSGPITKIFELKTNDRPTGISFLP